MIRARTVIADFEKAATHGISQILSVVGILSTWANLGGAEFRPFVMPEDYRQELGYFEVVGVFRTVAVAFG